MSEDWVSIIDHLITFLRSKLEDPRTDREGEWIWPEYPRLDAKRPRISVVYSGLSLRREEGLGQQGQLIGPLIDIDIWTDTVFSWDNPSDGRIYKGSSLKEFIASQVTDLFMKSRPLLNQDFGWNDVRLVDIVPYPYDEDHDEHRKTLRYVIEIDQE